MKTKICTKCGKEKALKMFCKDKRRRLGYSAWCKRCANLFIHAKYRENHRIEIRLSHNQWRKKDRRLRPEKYKILDHKWNQNNYKKHRGEIIKQTATYKIQNPEKYKEDYKKYNDRIRRNLNEVYIKRLLCEKTILKFINIPIELVEAKREHIKLGRLLKGA